MTDPKYDQTARDMWSRSVEQDPPLSPIGPPPMLTRSTRYQPSPLTVEDDEDVASAPSPLPGVFSFLPEPIEEMAEPAKPKGEDDFNDGCAVILKTMLKDEHDKRLREFDAAITRVREWAATERRALQDAMLEISKKEEARVVELKRAYEEREAQVQAENTKKLKAFVEQLKAEPMEKAVGGKSVLGVFGW